jgi:hypothetical protein
MRNLQLDLTAGAFRVEAFGTQRIQLSPEVAALVDSTTGVEAFHSLGLHGREGYALTLGFTVSPTRLPLSIW